MEFWEFNYNSWSTVLQAVCCNLQLLWKHYIASLKQYYLNKHKKQTRRNYRCQGRQHLLWSVITTCQNMFDYASSADYIHTPWFISGFQLNTEVVSTLVLRYMRKDGTLRFGDFVSAVLHLSVAFSECHALFAINESILFLVFLEWWFIHNGFTNNLSQWSGFSWCSFTFSDIFEKRDPLQNGAVKFSLGEVCFFFLHFVAWSWSIKWS